MPRCRCVTATAGFIGIAGLDVDLSASFEVLRLPAYLSEGSLLMQVVALRPPQVPSDRVVVLARQRAAAAGGDWQTLPELASFSVGNTAATDTITTAMFAGEDGHLRTRIEGEEHFVLYRRFGDASAYVVMVVPVAQATQAALSAMQLAEDTTRTHTLRLALIFLATSIVVLLAAVLASRHLTRPIEHLRQVVGELASGDFTARAEIDSGDELESLGEAFNAMVPRLSEHSQVQESLTLAREVQQQLLPPAAPAIDGYRIAARSEYSEQTGGDYFDYLRLGGDTSAASSGAWGVVVADVAGHGIGPALLMATTRAMLRAGTHRGLAPGLLFSEVNEQFAGDVSRGHFVTLFLVVLNEAHNRLCWASAGHDAALLFRHADATVNELDADDIPLGIDGSWQYKSHDGADMQPGDVLLMGTDGIWEAANAQGERFGKQRLREFVVAHRTESPDTICDRLLATLAAFRGEAPQNDDITVVVISRQAGDP